MNIEYHKWWSPSLGQDMEMKVYGHFGKPMLVFPAQGGRFFEFEDFKMIEAIQGFIEAGRVKVFTVDSLDNQSWANWNAHPADRARRHQDYDRYITDEVAPFIRQHCGDAGQKSIVTGCSMGAYHAGNFFFRHPDLFDVTIPISGLFQLRMFVGDYMDDNVYFNSPLLFLPGLNDPWFIDQYRNSQIIVCVGQGAWEDAMIEDAHALKRILDEKQIPASIDFWGHDVNHDWPWWRKMLPHHLEHLV
ncbi:MAG: transposase [Chloroflexi bacterium]|nr:transposase [Chloroflexota bacterium]